MKLGIIGFPNSGKKTLFRLLTKSELHEAKLAEMKPLPGTAFIRDIRFDSLVDMYGPKKASPAAISLELIPDFDRKTAGNAATFRTIAQYDAICLAVRAFEDDAVYHVNGSVNAERDADEIHAEFIMHDLIFADTRIRKIEEAEKKGKGGHAAAEKELMMKFKEHLEKGLPLRVFPLAEKDSRIISGYPLITLKKEVLAVNCGENCLGDGAELEKWEKRLSGQDVEIMLISAKVEGEIDALDSEDEKREFMNALGIREPVINRLSFLCMKTLGLISFFTVGKDEVRQWLVREGATAPAAGGVIHSDIERGFIRAELMKYEDLVIFESEQKLKNAGKYHVMGRDYVFEDGDIASFRFNV